MSKQKICDQCSEDHQCREVYHRLGQAKGPSVVFRVLVAFVVPIAVFIGVLLLFERFFGAAVDTEKLRTGLAFLSALAVTVAVIFAVRAANRRIGGKK